MISGKLFGQSVLGNRKGFALELLLLTICFDPEQNFLLPTVNPQENENGTVVGVGRATPCSWEWE